MPEWTKRLDSSMVGGMGLDENSTALECALAPVAVSLGVKGSVVARARPCLRDLDESLASSLSGEELARGRAITAEERRIAWAEGQRARIAVVRELGPGAKASVTHAGGTALCVGWQPDPDANALGIGVDLELLERSTTDRVHERILRDPERALGLAPMDLWVAKEAAFKAASGSGAETMTDFEITAFSASSGTGEARSLKGDETRLVFRILHFGKWRIGLAFAWRREVGAGSPGD